MTECVSGLKYCISKCISSIIIILEISELLLSLVVDFIRRKSLSRWKEQNFPFAGFGGLVIDAELYLHTNHYL